MPSLHLVERQDNVERVTDGSGDYESRYWAVSEDTSERLVGGDIYLHRAQDKPSHFGGKILSYRIHQGGEYDGRIIFRFRASMEHKGVWTGPERWGNEKKIDW
jgi:hypothetical protein